MMHVLLESGGTHQPRPAGWTAASVAIHAAVVTAAVVVTMREVTPRIERIPVKPVTYIRPAPPPAPVTPSTPISGPVLRGPDLPTFRFQVPTPGPIDITPMRGDPRIEPTEFGWGVPGGGPAGSPVGATQPHTAATVDRIVEPRPGNGAPAYPASLRSAMLEGEVLAQFVVDTAGRVDPASITIMRATHALFGDAVRRWLTQSRYRPAEAGGRVVAQLVQQPFGFSIRR